MPRRTTTIGQGAFGRYVDRDCHEWDVVRRIITRRLPLTEDAVFILLRHILRQNGGKVLKAVRTSRDVGGQRHFFFSPDVDLLEVRPNGLVIGYELKGLRRARPGHTPPPYYAGVDEALALLVNPCASPLASSTFVGSVFDHVYVVHPAEGDYCGLDSLKDVLGLCTPIGLAAVSHSGVREILQPKKNPFLNQDIKKLFLKHLDKFDAALEYNISLAQR